MDSLPIDPTVIDDADIGARRTELERGHETAIQHVRDTFSDVGFSIVVEFSPSEIINGAVGADHRPYYVLGACVPSIADQALQVTRDFGMLLPCNIVIREKTQKRQEVCQVNILKIARLVGIVPENDEWKHLSKEIEQLSGRAFTALKNNSSADSPT